ncbi:bone morphogenetic protein 2-like [Poecile atricapillus]|uniref:bone morphogenetic protein 2-like n=1 Tax=Poecile atricapillus TaxID=48891 RepID=UPI00273845EB|nr:bone morphogenetic protein 2-like [Poecile atricapillus]
MARARRGLPCPGPLALRAARCDRRSAHSPGRAQRGRAGPAEGPLPPHAARSRPRSMATRPPCLWLCLAGLLSLRAANALPLRPDPRDEVLAAALQRLREVFDIEELPPDVLPRRKPPQFMVDLFNKVADANGITRAPGLLQGDVVRSFEDRVHVDHRHFYFDISAMEKGEQMLKAEFRVFKLKRTHRSRRSDVQHFCKVEVYELLESENKPQKKHLIASRLLSLYAEGWEVFNVTQTVSKWVGNSSSNHGFWITTTHVSSNGMKDDVVTFAKSQSTLQESRNALLVLFTNSNKQRSHSFVRSATKTNPAKSDASHVSHDTDAIQSSSASMSRKPRAALADAAKSPLTACHQRELYVDFHAIGWSGWIIYPSGYNAFHCRGSCIFPLGESLNATNHATVQSIVYTLKLSQDVSMPCCVPDELKSLNLLYFDDKQNVVLKNYKDMVATRCGCH